MYSSFVEKSKFVEYSKYPPVQKTKVPIFMNICCLKIDLLSFEKPPTKEIFSPKKDVH